MRILLDVDGVVSDLVKHIFSYLENPSIQPEDIKSWDMIDYFSKKEQKYILEFMSDSEFWRTLPLRPKAKEGFERLKRADHDIYWVTSSYSPCNQWGDAREEWLKENFDTDRESLVITQAKYVVHGDIFIDDCMYHVKSWVKHNREGLAFLYDAPYNNREEYEKFKWENIPDFLCRSYV